ncbi:PH domain-containing protein [Paraliomyxa miuraensis]|uniref:PH domain-containing protein n=1 Tax=Paraliomyxa miuraensis TaxID=376150 RepID=UPI002256D4FA|nr:PH domain-containing protein [Paraliomyxa miuraensis]MCX4244176.1 PH domain-containing protein [Paraliomyxa miuraensis]
MQPQSPNPAHARPPAGSNAGPHDDVIYEGQAKHSVSIAGYSKWILVTIVGITLAVLLGKIDFFATMPLWVLGLVGLPGMLLVFLRHVTTRYKVTLRRVETEKGIISKHVDSLELWRVLDVRYSQTLFDRLTGNGRVLLVGTDKSDPELLLHGLPNHRQLFERLRDAVQSARQTSRPMELVGQDGHAEDMGGAWGGH